MSQPRLSPALAFGLGSVILPRISASSQPAPSPLSQSPSSTALTCVSVTGNHLDLSLDSARRSPLVSASTPAHTSLLTLFSVLASQLFLCLNSLALAPCSPRASQLHLPHPRSLPHRPRPSSFLFPPPYPPCQETADAHGARCVCRVSRLQGALWQRDQ